MDIFVYGLMVTAGLPEPVEDTGVWELQAATGTAPTVGFEDDGHVVRVIWRMQCGGGNGPSQGGCSFLQVICLSEDLSDRQPSRGCVRGWAATLAHPGPGTASWQPASAVGGMRNGGAGMPRGVVLVVDSGCVLLQMLAAP